ncbi:glycosyltransferase [Christiangramia sp.]|uniref:glycosyltransferase n=1 Tax=Christiangramia sp. TaxID=1931228 RepID=UPI00262B4B5C|nr:glycosyltransferase [Christiangramia sp.]
MPKTKILHIIKSLGRGGAEMLLPETLQLHNKDKFEFHYIYFLPWKDQMVEAIENAGGYVKCFPAKNNIELLLSVNKVVDYSKKNKINLIHAHLPWSGFLARLVHKRTKIPVVYTEHNIQERYHKLTKALNRLSFNWQSMALGVSKDVSDSINSNIHVKIPVKTLLNGVNTQKFSRDMNAVKRIRDLYEIPENALVVGNVAVFRKQKDLRTWVKAFRLISDGRPGVYGLLVGSGPQEEEIRDLIKDLNIQNLMLPGLQTDTIPYFSAMDIFMMSSEFEGLPVALLEAMSMECAVVSTKAGGVTEAVRNNKDGLLVDIGDVEALAENSLRLLNNKEELQCFKENARKRVVEDFSLLNMVQNLEVHYYNILNSKLN